MQVEGVYSAAQRVGLRDPLMVSGHVNHVLQVRRKSVTQGCGLTVIGGCVKYDLRR